jgi:ubiquinone/menaquinone biosynthesis C-methylase UbiE
LSEQQPICNYEGSDYQASFWDQGGREYEDQVEAIALSRLLPAQGRMLLELGAGAGRNTPRYAGFERVVLVDFSLSQLEQAQARLGNSDRYIYVAADVYRLPFNPGLFDAATMIRTLHHMADAPLALRQVRKALMTGAIFILEYANKRNIKAILRYALGRQSWSPFTLEPVEFVTLNYDFHPRAVATWLDSLYFRVERRLTVSHFRSRPLKRIIPLRLLVWMDSMAQLTGDWWQLSPSVFIRARAIFDEGIAPTAGGSAPAPARGERLPEPFELFRCPECGHSPLRQTPDQLECQGCGRKWLRRNGIYDFRPHLPGTDRG